MRLAPEHGQIEHMGRLAGTFSYRDQGRTRLGATVRASVVSCCVCSVVEKRQSLSSELLKEALYGSAAWLLPWQPCGYLLASL